MRKPDALKCTPQFKAWYTGLSKQSYMYKIVTECIEVLKENMLAGEKVEKKKWPREYKEQLGIRNLFRYDLDRINRLCYTIISDGKKKVVCILESMDHPTYERRFGYS